MRFWYCALSTVRTRAVIPMRSRFLANGSTMRSNCGLSSRISNSKGCPVSSLTSLSPLKVQPASFSNFSAARSPSRILPEPSYFGGSYSVVNTCVRDLAAELFEDFQLLAFRHSGRRQLGIVEIAARPLIGAVKQVLVRPFEVEGIGERLAHPRVLEQRPAQIVARSPACRSAAGSGSPPS